MRLCHIINYSQYQRKGNIDKIFVYLSVEYLFLLLNWYIKVKRAMLILFISIIIVFLKIMTFRWGGGGQLVPQYICFVGVLCLLVIGGFQNWNVDLFYHIMFIIKSFFISLF